MPGLTKYDQINILIPSYYCNKCNKVRLKNYCRQCDDLFYECDCEQPHQGHRSYYFWKLSGENFDSYLKTDKWLPPDSVIAHAVQEKEIVDVDRYLVKNVEQITAKEYYAQMED